MASAQPSSLAHEELDELSLRDSFSYLHELRNGRLNIVVIGKTGDGKSATINTLISRATEPRPNYFKEEESPYSVTKDFEECTVDLFGLNCRLVDTVGLFDTEMTPERKAEMQLLQIPDLEEEHKFALANLADVISLCTDGIDAFLVVVDGTRRLSFETRETLNVIQRFLGVAMFDHCIFVLTKEDHAQSGTMDKAEKALTDYLRSIGYAEIGDRFVRFDNRNRPVGYVEKLMKKIESNLKAREGFPYTNIAFHHAQKMLNDEKQKLQLELETNMARHIQTATDGVMAENEQEKVYIDEQLNEYAIAMCGVDDDAATNEIYRNEIISLNQAMINLDLRGKIEIDNAIYAATARCDEEFRQRFRQMENNFQQQNRLLANNNQIIQQLRNQVNNLANRR